jgi:mannose-1-phosphate guanylyltransferase
MLVMPSDHDIPNLPGFQKTVREAIARAATHDELITLGVRPVRPETGYGYLRVGDTLGGDCRRVDAFVEKPNLERAQEFLKAGNYLWNGGMFVWRVDSILRAFDLAMPEMKQAWDRHGGEVTQAYPELPATSIDFGVMEKARNVVTFPLDCGWDDLGSWTSLEALATRQGLMRPEGVVAQGESVAIDSTGLVIDMPGHLVATLGVKDLIIVEHGDAILIADKSRAQDIKKVVDAVKRTRPELA